MEFSQGDSALDFLTPGIQQIRHQINGIIDSYSHDWDILAELSQNSVDAIRARKPEKGHIKIRVDAEKSEIEFSDNGIGIKEKDLPVLLRPFSTNKIGFSNQIGSKVVGLTFVIFSSDFFQIETNDGYSSSKAEIKNCASWLKLEEDDHPKAIIEKNDKKESGTNIKLRIFERDHPIFSYSVEELEFLFRTKTAIGDTNFLWEDNFNASLELVHVTKDGSVTQREFDCKYLLPIEKLSNTDVLDLVEYEEWLTSDRSDAEKRRKLKDKIIYHSDWTSKANRTIRWWSCFVPTRTYWEKINRKYKLLKEEDIDDNTEKYQIFSGGLFTSTKGMPTGILLDVKPKGSAGYVPNFFILIEDPELNFDIGRKAIPGRQQGMLRDIAHEEFRQYINKIQKYISGEPENRNNLWNKEREFSEVLVLTDLNSNETRFVKRPDTQEATVAAIFFEQIGKGKLEKINPLITGYKKKYDLYAKYDGVNRVFEFKYTLSDLIKDFNDAKKMFDEVDVAVMWELTENDRKLVSKRGLGLEPVEKSTFSEEKIDFHYRLDLGPVDPIFIISMKNLIESD